MTTNRTFEPQIEPSEHIDSLLPITTITYRQMQNENDRIALLKKIMPTLTVITFVALVLWPVLNSKEGSFTLAMDRLEEKDENAKLIKPRYVGIDKNNHPVDISAEMAFRKSNDDKDYYLKNLLANMQMSNGTGIVVRATNGMLDAKAQEITLDGAVTIATKSNFNLSTDQALFLINEKVATGENGVTGETPFGTFSADRFHVDVDQEIIRLKDKVKLHFAPNNREELSENNSDKKQ